jgi:Kdo2-lipid IVA lauroyltransferase/acyltransferase
MSRDVLRRVRSAALRVAIPTLAQTLGRLPYPALAPVGTAIGWLLLATNRRYRRRTLDHLRLAFPEAGEDELRGLRRGCFHNASLNAVETLQLLARGREAFAERLVVEGWDHVEGVRRTGERILFVSAHSGFWELLGIVAGRHGLPLYSFARRPDDPAVEVLVRRVREAVAVRNIERGTADGRRLLREALRNGGAMAIFIDQDTKVEGTWVPFFGLPAYTPIGAAEMALRHGMRVIPSFLERRAGGLHVARFLPALELPEDPVAATARMTEAIEAHIRRHPEQWVWWHRRWRRQPG